MRYRSPKIWQDIYHNERIQFLGNTLTWWKLILLAIQITGIYPRIGYCNLFHFNICSFIHYKYLESYG
jgi:hypothetical protein